MYLSTNADVNLNTLPAYRYEGLSMGYSGAHSNESLVAQLASLPESRIGGGTYGMVYNPS